MRQPTKLLTPQEFAQLLPRYRKGQIKIENRARQIVLRGDLQTVVAQNNRLNVSCPWMNQGVGGQFPFSKDWIEVDKTDFVFDLWAFEIRDIGPEKKGLLPRLQLTTVKTVVFGLTATLLPRGGHRIERARVKGLDPAPAA